MSQNNKIDGIKACVFDAYGTLFDHHSAIGKHRKQLGDAADQISLLWRTKQLEYTWLRSLMKHHADFWQVTQDALDFAFDMHQITNLDLKNDLMNAYLSLECYPEVPDVLFLLKTRGFKLAILSNGTHEMLDSAVKKSGISDLIDITLSVEQIGTFKPDPSVYQLAVDQLNLHSHEIIFQSSNAWDASGASAFGFNVAWINRFGQSKERLPGKPNFELKTLMELPDLIH